MIGVWFLPRAEGREKSSGASFAGIKSDPYRSFAIRADHIVRSASLEVSKACCCRKNVEQISPCLESIGFFFYRRGGITATIVLPVFAKLQSAFFWKAPSQGRATVGLDGASQHDLKAITEPLTDLDYTKLAAESQVATFKAWSSATETRFTWLLQTISLHDAFDKTRDTLRFGRDVAFARHTEHCLTAVAR